jgi:hypothetical protein
MVLFLKIEKDGSIKEEQITAIDELYKKCNFRKAEGFNKICEFIDGSTKIELWGRTSGRINIKNTYDFPEKVNSSIYGICGLVAFINNKLVDLTSSQWENVNVNVEDSENDDDSIIQTPEDNKVSEQASEIASVSASSEYIDSELKGDDYLYSSEEEEEED